MILTRKGLLLEEDEIKVAPIAGSMMEFPYDRIDTLLKVSKRVVYDATSRKASKVVKEIYNSGITATPLMIVTSLPPDISVELIKSSQLIDMWKNKIEHYYEAEVILGAAIRAYTEMTGRAVMAGRYIKTGVDTFEVLIIRNIEYIAVIVVSINRIEIPVQAIVNVIVRLKEKGYYIQCIAKSIDSVGNYKVTMHIESKTDESNISLYTDEDADDEAIGIIEEAFNESGIKINTAFVDPTYGNPF